MKNKKQHLSENEARDLHEQALVIDTQQPPATSGFIFTEKMICFSSIFKEFD